MNWEAYLQYFNSLVTDPTPPAPYNDPMYLDYTRLNWSRTNRWLKQNPIVETTRLAISALQEPQEWIVITEPWCGDAAHIVPILYLMSTYNKSIRFDIQLRDGDSEIDQYLTHGTKSIPILVVRDTNGKDWFHWGPRPKQGAVLYNHLKQSGADFETVKLELQQFYNHDKSQSIQQELVALLQDKIPSGQRPIFS